MKYYAKEERKVLICITILTISMTAHYFFIGGGYEIFYFFKEYLMLVTLSYICYYFLYHMHTLIQGHILMTYIGIIIVLAAIIYLSVIAVYFTVVYLILDNSIFECSNGFWMLLRVADVVLGLLFLTTGIMISRSLRRIDILYINEARRKERDLW